MTTTHVQMTSLFAFQDVKKRLASRHKAIIGALEKQPDMTAGELCAALHIFPNQMSPRINELRRMGKVVCRNQSCPNPTHLGKYDNVYSPCQRKCRITGRTCIAWKILQA